jgi:hypothetical protein
MDREEVAVGAGVFLYPRPPRDRSKSFEEGPEVPHYGGVELMVTPEPMEAEERAAAAGAVATMAAAAAATPQLEEAAVVMGRS